MKKRRSKFGKLKYRALNPYNKLTFAKKLENNAKKMSKKMTGPEIIFAELLNTEGILYETQKIVGNKIFDFYLPGYNLIVEIDGDYFHANPSVYQEHQLNGMQKKNKRNDLFKNALASTMGYGMFRVWEKDLKENLEEVKLRLKLAIDGKK